MKPRSLVLLLAFLSLAAKMYCAATTLGASDVAIFAIFARSIHEGGLIETYKDTQYFNHTPLVGWFLISGIAAFAGIQMFEPTRAQSAVMLALKLIIIPSVMVIAWRRRGIEPIKVFQTLALVWAIFFVFAPGFGAQYLVWLAPCFLVASEPWYAALTFSSSIALFIFYNAISNGMPWTMGFTLLSTASLWTRWLILPWAVLAAFLTCQIRGPRLSDNDIAQTPSGL